MRKDSSHITNKTVKPSITGQCCENVQMLTRGTNCLGVADTNMYLLRIQQLLVKNHIDYLMITKRILSNLYPNMMVYDLHKGRHFTVFS